MSNVHQETPEQRWERLLGNHQKGETWQKFNKYKGGEPGWQANEPEILAYLFTELDDLREDMRAILSRMNAIDQLIVGAVKKAKENAEKA